MYSFSMFEFYHDCFIFFHAKLFQFEIRTIILQGFCSNDWIPDYIYLCDKFIEIKNSVKIDLVSIIL